MSMLIAQLNAKQNKKLTRPQLLALVPPADYGDGRTKQSFKDETDINRLLQRAQKSGTISHLTKHEGHYGDFSGFDFFEAQLKLAAGREIFDDLPSEIRSEFNQSPAAFFDYVNDPDNKDRLGKLLPELAAPGRQLIDVNGNISADEVKAREASEKTKTEAEAQPKPINASMTHTEAGPGSETISGDPDSSGST